MYYLDFLNNKKKTFLKPNKDKIVNIFNLLLSDFKNAFT